MKAIALFGPRDTRPIELPDTALDARAVRVSIANVGLCGSDTHFYAHGRVGAFELRGPLVLGHEGSGVVIETGRDVDTVSVGDRVAIEPGIPCGRCESCWAGVYNLCPEMVFPSLPPNHGFLAQHAVIPERAAHRIPAELTLEEAALLEPLSVALWASGRVGPLTARRVLVAGAGPIGALVARVALASGAAEVAVTDVDAVRLELLASEPRTTTVCVGDGWDAVPDDYDVFFECSGATGVLGEGLRHVRRRGTAVIVGVPPDREIAIPAFPMRFRELTVTYSFRYANTWPRAIRAVAKGVVTVRDLVSHRYSFGQVPQAFEDSIAHRAGLKPMVAIDGGA